MSRTTPLTHTARLPDTHRNEETSNYCYRTKSMLNQLSIVLEGSEHDEFEDLTIAVIEKAGEAITHANIGMDKALDSLKLRGGAE